ncbi:ABC-2 family transporter protein [Rosistilla carotiformis]|uniref:ABC-2 family transporter protein n=1 Tax=Rosistilla carotiformis TaxID=2528017 RepID=A0A518JRV4_9BACT|nr:ABC transporter permease subunit/CPBP intramembrane protease [Rosistilla carotiformis]QDV68260.1 ABC-2 family transporter protein [Rosistilla carotiformis]
MNLPADDDRERDTPRESAEGAVENELRSRPMSIRTSRLAQKELREILRDRRTIMTLILMPLLVYPLLGVTVQKFLLNSLKQQQTTVYDIGVANEPDGHFLLNLLHQGKLLLDEQQPKSEKTNRSDPIESLMGGNGDEPVDLNIIQPFEPSGTREQLQRLIADQILQVGVLVQWSGAEADPRKQARFELIYDKRLASARSARDELVRRLQAVNDTWTRQVLQQAKIADDIPAPYTEHYIVSKTQSFSMVTFVPLMLVLMTITGAVYPAIDLTAGERERGTMEILIAAPVPRISLLIGKFVAVLVVAMLTAVVNLIAMLITVYTLGIDGMIFGDGGVSVVVVLQILMLLLVFAAFFSAMMLGLTSFARSFKEAQAYLIPLMLVALAPGMLSLMPELKLNATLALVPLVNIVLAGRDLLQGTLVPAMFAITLISTSLYGLLALTLAARVFGTDSILYGSDGSWADLFRRPTTPRSAPSMPAAMFCLAVLFPCFIVIGGMSSRIEGSMSAKLVANAMVTVLLFVGLPWLFARFNHVRMTAAFFLKVPRWPAFLAAVLLGCSVWTMAYELEILTLSADRIELLKKIFEAMKFDFAAIPWPVKLLTLAAVPAICEEFFFRGFLLSGFLRNGKPWVAIVATAGLFGLFHVIVRDSLLFERFLPSSLMGLVLGFVCYRTGSLYPGIVLHALHNGILVSMSHFEKKLLELGIGVESQSHLPLLVMGAAVLMIVAGAATLARSPSRRVAVDPQPAAG